MCLVHFFTEIRGAQWKLHSGYFAFQYHKDPRAHGASWGKHSLCLSYFTHGLGATQKYLKNHFSQTCPPNCSSDFPARVGSTQTGEPKPHCRAVTKAHQGTTCSGGTASHRFWYSSTKSAYAPCRTHSEQSSLLIHLFLPSRVFLFSYSTTWFPAMLKKWYNKWL